jgi:hypothetical protein
VEERLASAVDALIDAEDETIAALHEVIPHSGRSGARRSSST